jgi:hypothetical protein
MQVIIAEQAFMQNSAGAHQEPIVDAPAAHRSPLRSLSRLSDLTARQRSWQRLGTIRKRNGALAGALKRIVRYPRYRRPSSAEAVSVDTPWTQTAGDHAGPDGMIRYRT